MSDDGRIKPVPWDSAAFGIDCYEIIDPDAALVARAITRPGHYTAKVDPLADKRYLHDAGFYYCDTLIEPWCTPEKLAHFDHPDVAFSRTVPLEPVAAICRTAFLHGRFHRDFNIGVPITHCQRVHTAHHHITDKHR